VPISAESSQAEYALVSSGLAGALLLYELKSTGTAYDAEPLVSGARALRIPEVSFDVVAIFLALMGKDSTRVLPRGDDAIGRQFGASVVRDWAFEQQVSWFSRGATLSPEVAALDHTGKLPTVTLGFSLGRAGHLGEPVAVEAFSCNGNPW